MATPVFAEVSEDSLTLDPADAAAALDELGGRATAMTATHVYGTPCDVEALQAARRRGRDPARLRRGARPGSSVRQGKPIGGFGVAEVFC